MAKYEHFYLDPEGLKDLLVKIKEYYASKEALGQEKQLREAQDELLIADIQTLSDNLAIEVQARANADSALSDRIDTEVSVRTETDTALSDRIDSEAQTRESEDALLHSAITEEQSARVQAISSLEEELTEGLTELKTALETVYHKDPDTEEETGILIDKINQVLTSIGTLDNRLTNETTFRTNADEAIRASLASEHDERIATDIDLGNAITNESTIRSTKDAELTSAVKAIYYSDPETLEESGLLVDKINNVLFLLDTEIQNLSNRSEGLESELDTEISNRESADASIRADLDSEHEERVAAEGALSSELTDKITEVKTEISEEATAREEADTEILETLTADKEAIDADIASLSDRVTTLEESSGIILDTEMSDESGNAVQNKVIKEYIDNKTFDMDSEMSDESENAVQNKVIKSYIDNQTVIVDSEMSDASSNAVQNRVIKDYIDRTTFSFKLKGTVQNYEDLPTENLSRGDMYNVVNPSDPDQDHHYDGNTNFVWDGEAWFALSSTIDLSDYYTKGQIDGSFEALDNKYYTQEQIDETFYTKSQINSSLENLDNEYYTKEHIDDTFYTKSQIDSELEALDDKYYTQEHIDETFYTKAQVDSELEDLDNKYYTQDFIDQNYYKVDHIDDFMSGILDDYRYVNERIDDIETQSGITEIKVNDTALVPDHGSVSLYTSIQVCDSLPEDGDIDKIYRVGDKLYKWANNAWSELGTGSGGGGEGTDPELRTEFETFRDLTTGQIETLSSAMATEEELEEHLEASNPHNITKETIGLDKVLNYSPTEILAPAMEILEDKVNRDELSEELEAKVSVTDIIDDLVTPETDKPLSANQGIVLDEKIEAVSSRITSLGAALVFKGTVSSYEALPVNADNGDCYQIYAESEQDPHHGEVYAKTESGWTQIVASAQDMSSLVASAADINRIISDYS